VSHGFPLLQRITASTASAIYEGLNRWLNILNGALQGRINVVYSHDTDFTLTANAATSTLTDARLSPGSAIIWMPRTANASAEIGAGTIYHDVPGAGTVVINHANNAQTDRKFRIVIVGG
jgi:hypothetical protein